MFGAMKMNKGRHLRAILDVHVSLQLQMHMIIDMFEGYTLDRGAHISENITCQKGWPTFGPSECTCDLGVCSSLQSHHGAHWAYFNGLTVEITTV